MIYRELGEIVKLRSENIKDNKNPNLLYVSTTNMNPNKTGIDITSNNSIDSSGKRFQEGDVLVSNIRPYFKKIWKADRDGFSSADVLNFIPRNDAEINKTFLFYLLSNDEFFAYMMATSKGTKMPRGDKEAIKKYRVPLFTIEEQDKIANLLSSFDDKIENNNAIIANLEEQGQAIFKSWFVDFGNFEHRFFVESELGSIPKKWEVVFLEELSDAIITGKTPPTKKQENYGNKMPFITIPDMHNNIYVVKSERYLSEIGISTQKNKSIPKNSVIVSCIATVGLVSLVSEDSQTNQQINAIIPKSGISPYYLYFSMKSQKEYLNAIGSSGSTTKNVNKKTFSELKIIRPEKDAMCKFHKVMEPIFSYILFLQQQTEKLIETRDALLPKLMSGEIRVGDVDAVE